MLKKGLLTLVGAALLGLPLAALAQSREQLVERYTTLAGSKQNATALVTGLREGKQVRLTRGTSTETFTPPTGKMGYGHVDNALALAEASLKEKGITKPAPAQLEKSLMDILKMRADGKGWGQIAYSLGFQPGEVKRGERVAKTERRPKPERPQRPEKPR
jgi:hypothetical protein